MSPHCPHRGADLFFGRNEDGGIRCAYHGWKFATDGRCLATCRPWTRRSARAGRAGNIRLLTPSSTREAGGIIWAYLGPREQQPDLPELEFLTLPASRHVFVSKKLQQCNWAQACEAAASTLRRYFSFFCTWPVSAAADVTSRLMSKVSSTPDTVRWMRDDGAPRFTIAEHPAGLVLGAARRGDPGQNYWRISQFLMPNRRASPRTPSRGENYHGQSLGADR